MRFNGPIGRVGVGAQRFAIFARDEPGRAGLVVVEVGGVFFGVDLLDTHFGLAVYVDASARESRLNPIGGDYLSASSVSSYSSSMFSSPVASYSSMSSEAPKAAARPTCCRFSAHPSDSSLP